MWIDQSIFNIENKEKKFTKRAEWNPGWSSKDFSCCSAFVRPRGSWDEAASSIFLKASILRSVFVNHHGDVTLFPKIKIMQQILSISLLFHSSIFCLATTVSQLVVRNCFDFESNDGSNLVQFKLFFYVKFSFWHKWKHIWRKIA